MLHKEAFRYALVLSYGWLSKHIPTDCLCGRPFSMEDVLSCSKGGFPIIRHNEIRNFTTNLISELCCNVSIEPSLQPLSGEELGVASTNREENA